MVYKHILVAMDEKPVSRKAALKGIEIAKRDGARVIGVHVLDINDLNVMDVGAEELRRLKDKQRQKGEEALDYLRALAKKNKIELETIIKAGEPDKLILKVADVHDVDLIVLGTHGRRGFAKLLQPETSDEIRAECPGCSILIAE